jgi:membrane fusion protein, heavy metal efflux system
VHSFQFHAVALALLASACSSTADGQTTEHAPPASTPRPDGTVRVQPQSRSYVVSQPVALDTTSAIVRAPAKVAFRDGAVSQVSTPVPGRVTAIQVKTGDRVKAGDVLLVLSSPDAAAARASAAAALAEHEAATKELARQESMASTGVGIDSERVSAQAKLRQSEAELARARTTAAILGDGGGATITLRAPIDGTIIARRATLGGIAQPGGDALIEIGNPTALWLVAEVFERDLAQVHDGAAVDIEVSTLKTPVRGHIVALGSALTGSLRTAPVYVGFDGDPQGLRAGMFARAAIRAGADKTIVLPAAAVLIKDGKHHVVYVKTEADVFAPREVEVGPSVDGMVQVLSGLQTGEEVVVKGALLLDGAADQLL